MFAGGLAHMVERLLCKQEARGSHARRGTVSKLVRVVCDGILQSGRTGLLLLE